MDDLFWWELLILTHEYRKLGSIHCDSAIADWLKIIEFSTLSLAFISFFFSVVS